MHAMTRRSTATVVLAMAIGLGAGCRKEKEYLVTVSLTTYTPVTGLSSAKITIGGTAQTFPLSQLSDTPTVFGVYVPDDVGKQVQVSAGAQRGSSCVGLAGSGTARIGDDGVGATEIELQVGNACSDPQPPSLLNCREYDHAAAGEVCDATTSNETFIRNVAFSPDGRFLATAGSDGRVKIWTFDGRVLRAEGTVIEKPDIETSKGLPHIAFSPDGKLLAVAMVDDYDAIFPVDLYEVGTWKKRRSLDRTTGYDPGVGFSPDSQHVIVVEWDGDVTTTLRALPVDGGPETASVDLPFKPWWLSVGQTETTGGVPIAVAAFDDRVALLSFDGRHFSTPNVFSVTNDPNLGAWAIGISPDGRFLAAGGDNAQFAYWNIPFQSATPTSDPFDVTESLTTLVFSPANDYVAVASGAADTGTVSIWDLLAHTLRGYYLPSFAPYAIAYAPNGTAVAGGEDGCAKVFVCAD